jgi:hypothetical protein
MSDNLDTGPAKEKPDTAQETCGSHLVVEAWLY